MLKLVIYKKKACIYLVGGTKDAVITFGTGDSIYQICSYLTFNFNQYFWDDYQGIYYKGKFHESSDAMDTAIIIKKILMEK